MMAVCPDFFDESRKVIVEMRIVPFSVNGFFGS
jgi:hypothetical protein